MVSVWVVWWRACLVAGQSGLAWWRRAAGRGVVIADVSVAELIAAASADRVTVHTSARDHAMTVLARPGAEVAATGPDVLTISGISSERTVVRLSGNAIPFAEVTAHRASLEEAYMELTRDAVEFRTGAAS